MKQRKLLARVMNSTGNSTGPASGFAATIYILAAVGGVAALVSAASTALCGFGGAIIFVTVMFIAEASGLTIDPVTLITISYINSLIAAYLLFLQNPCQYIAHWKMVALLSPPLTVGSVLGVLILSLIAGSSAVMYVKMALSLLFIVLGMYFVSATIVKSFHKDHRSGEGVNEEGAGEVKEKRGNEKRTQSDREGEVLGEAAPVNISVTSDMETTAYDREAENTHIPQRHWLIEHPGFPKMGDLTWAALLAGTALLAGFLGGLTSIPGPPLILLFALARVDPKKLPLVMIPVFLPTTVSSLITAVALKMLDWSLYPAFLGILFGVGVGALCGLLLRKVVNPEVILFVLYILVALSGLNASGAFQLSMPIGVIALIIFGAWVTILLVYYLTRRFVLDRTLYHSAADVPTAPFRTRSEAALRMRSSGEEI